jgi:hypothetical protein
MTRRKFEITPLISRYLCSSKSDVGQHTEAISSGSTPHTAMGAPSFSALAENVWVPVISRAAGLSSVCERQPPRFHYLPFSLIFQNKSRKKLARPEGRHGLQPAALSAMILSIKQS